MRSVSSILLVCLVGAAFLPVAAAAPPPIVDVCVKRVTEDACARGDVCVGISTQVPVCANVPCYDGECVSDPGDPGLVYVCVKRVTDSACYRNDACVGFSTQIPACANVPCYDGECFAFGPPSLPPLVGVCVAGVTTAGQCWRDHDACVGFSYQVPQCVDGPDVVLDLPTLP